MVDRYRLSRSYGRCRMPLTMVAALMAAAAALGQIAPAPSLPAPPDQAVKLDPFAVPATSSNSYTAMNSNSLTAFSLPLDRIPQTADIIDRTFLDDVGALGVEASIAAYDAGASFSPQDNGGAVSTAAWGHGQPGDVSGNNPTVFLRGFPVEGMLTNGQQLNFGNIGQTGFEATSAYDLDRIEIIDGPQALMYSGSGPGGAVNIVTKQAYFNQPAFGEFTMRFDQYGSKYSTLDYGASEGDFAGRVALVEGTNQSRRVNIADSLQGAYVQLAAKLGNTTVRATLQQSIDSSQASTYLTLTSAGDPQYSQLNGQHLENLLATGQAAGIMGGALNWNNVESLGSSSEVYSSPAESAVLEADSNWTNWLSSKIQIGGANFDVDRGTGSTFAFYSPMASANPLPGNWTVTASGLGDGVTIHKNKSLTGIVLMNNALFGGRAKSQTSFEYDYENNLDVNTETFQYYQADANWNVIVNPNIATNNGRTPLPPISWTVNSGPKLYTQPVIAYGTRSGQRLTYNGVNYVRQQALIFDPAEAGYGWDYVKYYDAGGSFINHTEWLNGKLDTLIGARFDRVDVYEPLSTTEADEMRKPDFSVGAVYHLLPWLSPYLNASNIWQPKLNEQNLANITYNNGDPSAYSIEAGVKINADDSKISGSISGYRSYMHNDITAPDAISAADVDPNGLNGVYGTPASPLAADVTTYGVTAALTALPVPNWRMRLSAAWTGGTYTGGETAPQYYNDQFYEDSSGDVTYADGTVVYVPSTFNKSQLTVSSSTPGAVPLTVNLLSTPTSQYYANPAAITGAISKTSNGGLVLLNGNSTTHGSILTGALGLPMTQYQLNTALSGVVPTGGFYLDVPNEQTFGYPVWSFNFTNVYEFAEGPLKGLELGGTATVNWRYFLYDWYSSTSNLTPASLHTFYLPTMPSFSLIAGYSHKFGRLLLTVQLNIKNMFNTYKVIQYPYVLGGYSIPADNIANFDGQPRQYVITTKVRF